MHHGRGFFESQTVSLNQLDNPCLQYLFDYGLPDWIYSNRASARFVRMPTLRKIAFLRSLDRKLTLSVLQYVARRDKRPGCSIKGARPR
ncbi:unnamed protein product [Protopolystoma xenopodis]|uniref:Uncharacterized protein n=1 Tax=Protopolystoma xenopodis TaxID=117903 RepID=A0A3S5BMK9_9PLAT|nr:unnamed protein product [Protopolystoma xenopodis]